MQHQWGRGGVVLCFCRETTRSKMSAPPPHGNAQTAAPIRRRGAGASSHSAPIRGSAPGPGGVGGGGGGGGVCFLSQLTGVLVLALRADGWGPRTRVGSECWVWCGCCSCFLLWRASNIQKKRRRTAHSHVVQLVWDQPRQHL